MNAPAPDGPVRRGRLLLWAAAALAVAVAAWLLLPAGLVRLAVLAALAFPAAAALVDRPRWIFAILVVILFSNIDIFFSIRVFRLVLAFLLAAFVLSMVRGRRIVVHDALFTALAAAFLVTVFQSLAVAREIAPALDRFGRFAKVLLNVAIVAQFTRTREEFLDFLLVLVAGVAINNFLPLVVAPPTEYQTTSLLWTEGVFRYEGFALEPNEFAMLQIFTIPLLIFLAVRYRRPWFARPLFVLLVAGSVLAIALSFSRGGFVSLVFLAFCLVVVERRNRWVAAAGVTLVAAAAILAPAVYWSRITSLVEAFTHLDEDFAVASRIMTMKTAIALGLRNPLFGVGIDNFILHASRYVPFGLVVHNAPLQVFAECGLPALGLLVAIVVCNLRAARRLAREADADGRLLGRMLLVQQLAVLFNAMFLPVAFEITFWIALALPTIALAAWRRPASAAPDPAGA
ncbi:MAG: O-antigen ligase family protein [Candidatus Krumholzibacteriota bacterium]|nr:O-antigen ligase family protein [Candidatus Krumholzibacteriota bacterium]